MHLAGVTPDSWAPYILVGLLALFGTGVAIGTVTAGGGSTPAVITFEPEIAEVDPGETVTVDVGFYYMVGPNDPHIQAVEFTAAYDTEVVTLVDIEHGTWFEGAHGTNVTVERDADVNNDAGRVTVAHARTPGGSRGQGTLVRLTFEIAEDAPPVDAVLAFANAETWWTNGDPHAIIEQEGVVRVDGGGERQSPLETEDGPGIITPEETPEETSSEPADTMSGLGFEPVVAALILACVTLLAHRRW